MLEEVIGYLQYLVVMQMADQPQILHHRWGIIGERDIQCLSRG